MILCQMLTKSKKPQQPSPTRRLGKKTPCSSRGPPSSPSVAALVVRTAEQGPGLLWNPPPQAPAVRPRGTPPNSAGCQEGGGGGWGGGGREGQAHSISSVGCYFETPTIQGIPSRALHVHSRGHPSSIHTHAPHTATVRPQLSQKRVHTVTVHRSGRQPGKRLRQVLGVDWGSLGREFWGLCPHAGSTGGTGFK